MRVPRPMIEEHLKLAPDVEAERVRVLRDLFQKAGCPRILEQTVPEEQSPNLICLLPGNEEGVIVVGASLDYAPEDAKAPAHWSALAMLPLLAKSLAAVPHRSTLVLVAFPGHAHGMRGASRYVSQLTEVERKTMRAMVDLDNLGRTSPVYALAQADKTLATWLQAAAHSLKLTAPPQLNASTSGPPLQNSLPAIKDEDLWADAKPFAQEHLPAIAVQSASPEMLPALRRDGSIPDRFTGTGFDLDSYDDTYRLLCVYLLYLDGNLGRPPIKPGTYVGTILDTAGFLGTRTTDISMKIDRFTTMSELDHFEQILKKGGQEGLADALDKEGDKGAYSLALRQAVGVGIVVLQYAGKTPYVYLVSSRLLRPKAGIRSIETGNYHFDLIKLNLDDKGEGDGLYYDSVKLRFNSKHELEIEDYHLRPDNIMKIRLEPPNATGTKP
jgi:hypothetical protein